MSKRGGYDSFVTELITDYHEITNILNCLDKRIADDNFPECVGERHGELIITQHLLLQSLLNVIKLRLKDIGIYASYL